MRPILFIAMLLILGGLAGVSISYGTAYGIHKTSGEKFCVSCHEMDPMVATYKADVHGGSGELGASARCVDCHLPHDSLANYIFTKAKNGILEVGIHFFGEPEKIDWVEKLKHRDQYVYDTGCMECHGNAFDKNLVNLSKQAQKMHNHYSKLKYTDKEITCASCHFDAGHKGLRNALNYYKPEYEIYRYEMEDKKLELQKKYKDYGIIQDEKKLHKKHVEHKPVG